MNTEVHVLKIVEEYFKGKGWNVSEGVRVRGREIDIIAVMNEEIAAIEVKGGGGDIQRGIEQALHQRRAVNLSYLAISKERSSNQVMEICKNLGIGLILVNGVVKEVVKPTKSKALSSVKKAILGEEAIPKAKMSVKSSLNYLFRSNAQILILKLLFLNPDNEFHVHEIARRTGVSASYVTKEMKGIERIGLVNKRQQGNLVLYRINPKCMIFDELRRIFLKYELLDEMIAKELPREQVTYALIYGSFAKGTEKEGSDIDLFVVGRIDDDKLLSAITNIESKIGREINYIRWADEEFKKKVEERASILRSISENPVIMITGEEDEFRKAITR